MVCEKQDVEFFFFNDTATTEIYTLSLHDALPIFVRGALPQQVVGGHLIRTRRTGDVRRRFDAARRLQRVEQRVANGLRRSEEHTSELQSRQYIVCRLLLEKKIFSTIS